jgi:hypothetical protein
MGKGVPVHPVVWCDDTSVLNDAAILHIDLEVPHLIEVLDRQGPMRLTNMETTQWVIVDSYAVTEHVPFADEFLHKAFITPEYRFRLSGNEFFIGFVAASHRIWLCGLIDGFYAVTFSLDKEGNILFDLDAVDEHEVVHLRNRQAHMLREIMSV